MNDGCGGSGGSGDDYVDDNVDVGSGGGSGDDDDDDEFYVFLYSVTLGTVSHFFEVRPTFVGSSCNLALLIYGPLTVQNLASSCLRWEPSCYVDVIVKNSSRTQGVGKSCSQKCCCYR